MFAARTDVSEVEEGRSLALRFDEDGLIPVVTTDADTGEVAPADGRALSLEFTIHEKVFDPDEVYGDAPNPTRL